MCVRIISDNEWPRSCGWAPSLCWVHPLAASSPSQAPAALSQLLLAGWKLLKEMSGVK